ncbi:unnamed protein product, partial [Owenia fusiformis]
MLEISLKRLKEQRAKFHNVINQNGFDLINITNSGYAAHKISEVFNTNFDKTMAKNSSTLYAVKHKRKLSRVKFEVNEFIVTRNCLFSASTKSGGGTQGREVKQKATKNKYKRRGDHDDDSEDEAVAVQPKG